MTRFSRRVLVGLAVLAAPLAARAQSAPPEAPAAAPSAPAAAAASTDLPAICTDRPTKSNAACTVEPGHLQYEADVFNGSLLRLGGLTTDTYLATNPTLKYGLTRTIDLEANIAPYEVVRTRDRAGDGSTLGGVGDLYLRAKFNLVDQGDGKLLVTVLPYVKAPVARRGLGNGAWDGGVIAPVNYKLNDAWTLTFDPEVDAYKDSGGDGRHLNHAELVNLGRSLPHNVTVYGELWADWNYDPAGTIRQYSADLAVAWGLSKYLQLDGGLNFGLNRYTPGVQAYVGVSQKF